MVTMFSHAMLRVHDLEKTKQFFIEGLGLEEKATYVNDKARYTMAVLKVPKDDLFELHLTRNHTDETYRGGRNFGHIAFVVQDIYQVCKKVLDLGFVVARPPREGHMAFVRTPEGISIELVQFGERLPAIEPWRSMENVGEW